MGAINFTLDPNLIRELKRLLPLPLFVETGTFRGESLDAVQPLFDECLSIELSPEYYAAAATRFTKRKGVRLLLGDSPVMLRENRSFYADRSTLFWLDAHWCAAENTAGEKSQCPLLDELAAISPLHPRSAILIDDARLFLSAPPKPHEISAWPSLDAVLLALHRLSDRHALVCFNDVLVFVPADILPALRPFLHEHTVNLLTLADKARDFDTLLAQAKAKDQENASLVTQAKAKDQENASLVTQAKAKDQENASLVTQAKAKDQEIEEKDQEIKLLHTIADERLAVIHRLDVALTQTRRTHADLGHASDRATPDLTALTDEVSALRVQLAEARRQAQSKQARLRKLELEAATNPRKTKPSFPQRLLARWQSHLADASLHPLGQLQQHSPRPLERENFPRLPHRAKWPRICLATPSYQQGQFLERTMLSVLNQNYPNLAYGVQDGGSSDGSAEIITRHIAKLEHAESAPDKGQSDAIRRGFAKLFPTTQDIMGWVNSDDLLMPGTLHYVGAYFARHPEVDVIYGHRVIINEQDQEIGRWFMPQYHADTLKWFDLVPQETMFWRAHCYQEIGGLNESFQFALDWDLLLRFEQAACTIRRLPYFLGCFRAHSEQKTSAKIHTVGEQEMQRLRRRTHGREVSSLEIQRHLTEEINRSAVVAWLHGHGMRF